MALKGLHCIEMVGLAPSPLCGMLLADFGARVTRIEKDPNSWDVLYAGKESICLNLKNPKAVDIVKRLCKKSDVLIEPYRPGVMEKLGLGPDVLLRENPRLIYARLTGFGSDGRGIYANRAGHDINYVAISGLLSMLGRKGEKPTPPINLAADFAGGGLLCAFGILAALLERHRSGKGQIVDCAMVEGAAYVASWLFQSRNLPVWYGGRGENFLDSGNHSYDTYETKDKKFMSVGALEPQFYEKLLQGLQLDPNTSQLDDVEANRKVFAEKFKTKTQKEWCDIFDKVDACVFPVLEWDEANQHEHNKARDVFVDSQKSEGVIVPNPAPKLSRTPARSSAEAPKQNSVDMAFNVLSEIDIEKDEAKKLYDDGVLILGDKSKL